ncbi:MAG: hypothetical protein ACK4WH_03530 [Phycisphaerales bacterium]
MRRLYKWWTCLEPRPGETPEQHMQRTTDCYRENGVPTLPTPEEIEEIDKTLDELLNLTDAAPGTIGTSVLTDFRDVLFEVKAKIG